MVQYFHYLLQMKINYMYFCVKLRNIHVKNLKIHGKREQITRIFMSN